MFTWYEIIWCWLTCKCCWCNSRDNYTITFKGNNKYTDLTICEKCFNKKWPNLNMSIINN